MKPVLLLLAGVTAVTPARAQSLLYRSPNLGGTWVPDAAVIQFDFLHRFYVAPAPSHAVFNSPTFTLAAGLGKSLSAGAWFGTHSLAGSANGAQSSNETEVFARWRFFGGPEGSDGVHAAVTPAYDFLAKSVDGELGVDWTTGPLTLEGAARLMSRPLGDTSGARAAFGGGAVVRLTRFVALSADLGSFVGPTVHAAWSAGLVFQIPNSPHTFALEVSTAQTSTIQGNSIGTTFTPTGTKPLYGFEFTIPLHLARFAPWFHPNRDRAAAPASGAPAAATIHIKSIAFTPDTVVIRAGETVAWVNDDPLDHTVTFDDSTVASDPIHPGASFRHTFTKPGTYGYHCTPHPFMKAVVIVQ